MPNRKFRTPLIAAFFCAAFLAACTESSSNPEAANALCPSGATPIASVQGNATVSPMRGQQVTVQGIVTLVQHEKGLYIEQPGSDRDDRTSNAVFIQTKDLPAGIAQGALISAKGEVSEIGKGRYTLTAITGITEMIKCASGEALPLTDISLPLNGPGREALESMRIQINDSLMVSDVYQFGRGNFTLSGNGPQFVPTEVMNPGRDTARMLTKNRAFALPALLTPAADHTGLLVSGASIKHITGVLGHDGRDLRISLQSIESESATGFELPAAAANGSIRSVGMNLHNYFNGNGKGSDFPTPRGAKTFKAFQLQRDRIGAAIKVLDPHILGVMELENDGFGSNSAAQDLIQLANHATGKPWAVSRPAGDNTGTDVITVGVFYRSDRLKPVGPAKTLTGPEFNRSRQPLAQVFQPLPDGEKVLVVINHLKSKGSCPDSGENANQKDGQGCWNPMRQASAEKMSAWAKAVAESAGTNNILVLGDMNAYRNEDPIGAIRDAGFTELMDKKQGRAYSFVFYGQRGTLDYAFCSEALLENVQQAFIWNVNAALPVKMDLPEPWLRFSDHDPVVVDILVRQSSTSD